MQKEALPGMVNNFSVMLLHKWYSITSAPQQFVAVSLTIACSPAQKTALLACQ
jgi:hypothetical protein